MNNLNTKSPSTLLENLDIYDEMKWVEKVILHKDNNMHHYPALKQLIKNFHIKYNSKCSFYERYLTQLLKARVKNN